ncbi:MAG: hypothetical protein AAGI66_01300 [Cyanobacteria bacterium P01_H01_bin.74]
MENRFFILKNEIKRLFPAAIALLLVFFFSGASFSNPYRQAGFGFGPQTYNDGFNYGAGIYFAPPDLRLYQQPDYDSELVGRLYWHNQYSDAFIEKTPTQQDRIDPADTFICFYPKLSVAMLPVVSTTDDGWAEVIYQQAPEKIRTERTAWVPIHNEPAASGDEWPEPEASETKTSEAREFEPENSKPVDEELENEANHWGVYQTWVEFMKLNAKSAGVYWLSGVSNYQHALRMRDNDDAKIIPVTVIKKMRIQHVRANWMLVEVSDFQGRHPIGWVRWRDKAGKIMAFPNLSGEHLPIVMVGL